MFIADIETLSEGCWFAAIVSLVALVLISLIFGLREEWLRRVLTKEYPRIYRVKSVPSDTACALKAEGASIEVGDYGWEAQPLHKDGLIYLHGLNDRWQVVWYAGFQPDQVEVVGPKPHTQYNLFPDWADVKGVPPCPFSVHKYRYGQYPACHFGFPAEVAGKCVQGREILE